MHRVLGRRVQLGPPSDEDLEWILAALRRPEVWRALGWSDGIGKEIYTGYIEDTVLLLPFTRPAGDRVGFVLLMRDSTAHRVWSVNVVVPDPRSRNGFTTLAALDALTHLVFDVREDAGLVWLIEPSNGASRVLPKRLGYEQLGDVVRGGTLYHRYGITRAEWDARKARLAEAQRPLAYAVEPVPWSEVAHGRIIRAVRGAAGHRAGTIR